MMAIELTKCAKTALKNAYALYRERLKSGTPKSAAAYFDAPGWGGGPKIEGMEDARSELCAVGLIKTDILGGFTLTDDAILFMENRPKNTAAKILDFISKFVP